MLIWSSISILLLLLYIIYRRRQNKTDEELIAPEEPLPVREPSEYRLSAVRALPTIVEENPTPVSPIENNQNLNPLASIPTTTTSALVFGKATNTGFCHEYSSLSFFVRISDENDSPHLSSTSVRQRKLEKTDIDETDDFVRIPPISNEQFYFKNKDSNKVVQELTTLHDEAGHPVIFRKISFFGISK